jgi:hypothetical protein
MYLMICKLKLSLKNDDNNNQKKQAGKILS